MSSIPGNPDLIRLLLQSPYGASVPQCDSCNSKVFRLDRDEIVVPVKTSCAHKVCSACDDILRQAEVRTCQHCHKSLGEHDSAYLEQVAAVAALFKNPEEAQKTAKFFQAHAGGHGASSSSAERPEDEISSSCYGSLTGVAPASSSSSVSVVKALTAKERFQQFAIEMENKLEPHLTVFDKLHLLSPLTGKQGLFFIGGRNEKMGNELLKHHKIDSFNISFLLMKAFEINKGLASKTEEEWKKYLVNSLFNTTFRDYSELLNAPSPETSQKHTTSSHSVAGPTATDVQKERFKEFILEVGEKADNALPVICKIFLFLCLAFDINKPDGYGMNIISKADKKEIDSLLKKYKVDRFDVPSLMMKPTFRGSCRVLVDFLKWWSEHLKNSFPLWSEIKNHLL